MKVMKLATSLAICGVEAGVPSSQSISPSQSCRGMPMIMWSKYLHQGPIVRVEVLAFGHVHAIWWLEVVAGHDVVDIVDTTGPHADLSEVRGPDSAVGILGLVLREVGRVDVVVNVAVALIPLLVVVLLEVLMRRMDGEVLAHPSCQLQLIVDFFQQQVVFFAYHAVAVRTVSAENLEPQISNQQKKIRILPSRGRTPAKVPVPLLTLPESKVPMNLYWGQLTWPRWVPTSVTCSSQPWMPQKAPMSSLQMKHLGSSSLLERAKFRAAPVSRAF